MMTLCYDLHSHSTASDGELSPADLIAHAHRRGVDVLALTDHDVTSGLAEARAAADRLDLELVPGVEISVTWKDQTIHILGLRIDPENINLQEGMAGLRAFRDWRAEEMGRRLEKHGIADAYAGAKHYAFGSILSRTHFARFLVAAGHAKNMQHVFKRFLVKGKPGYVPGQWATLEGAVGWIRGAGGHAVVAHPARYKFTATRMHAFLDAFKQCGGEGMEVVSGSHSRDDYYIMADYARRFSLMASSGSDYHGPANVWLEPGCLPELPSGCIPIWTQWS
jgi:predicted metal-dependent phosphoesterase TrpH